MFTAKKKAFDRLKVRSIYLSEYKIGKKMQERKRGKKK